MTLDSLLCKAHEYQARCATIKGEKLPYFDPDGPTAFPWSYSKGQLLIPKGLALATLKKIRKMLPALTETFKNSRTLSKEDKQMLELSITVFYIAENAKTKIEILPFKCCFICPYIYKKRVASTQRYLMRKIIELPLSRYAQLITELLPIQRSFKAADKMIQEIQKLKPRAPTEWQNAEKLESFFIEKEFQVTRIKALKGLWSVEFLIKDYHEWSITLTATERVAYMAECFVQEHNWRINRFPSLLFEFPVMKFSAKSAYLRMLCTHAFNKHRWNDFIAATSEIYSSIKWICGGCKENSARLEVAVKNT